MSTITEAQAQFYWGDASDDKVMAFLKKNEGRSLDASDQRRFEAAVLIAGKRGLLPAPQAPAAAPAPQAPSPQLAQGQPAGGQAAPHAAVMQALNQALQGSGIVLGVGPNGQIMPIAPGQNPTPAPNAQPAPQGPSQAPGAPAKTFVPPVVTTAKVQTAQAWARQNGMRAPTQDDVKAIEMLLPGACDLGSGVDDGARATAFQLILGGISSMANGPAAGFGAPTQPQSTPNGAPIRPRPAHMPKFDAASAQFYWSNWSQNDLLQFVADHASGPLSTYLEKKYHAAVFLLEETGAIAKPTKPRDPDADEPADIEDPLDFSQYVFDVTEDPQLTATVPGSCAVLIALASDADSGRLTGGDHPEELEDALQGMYGFDRLMEWSFHSMCDMNATAQMLTKLGMRWVPDLSDYA